VFPNEEFREAFGNRGRPGISPGQLALVSVLQFERDRLAQHEQTTKAWKERYAARAGIEGTIHQAVAVGGMRRTRYRGLAKTHLSHVLTAAAVNMIRLDAWWTGTPLAQTRTSRLAALALVA
jgi:hypothetical protein